MSALIINLRLALFSATLAPHWRGTRLRSRLVAAATLIDPTWMLASRRFTETAGTSTAGAKVAGPAAGRRFYGGASTVLWFGWGAMVTIGMVAGQLVPPQAGLELLVPLCLVALVVPSVRSASSVACVVAAATVAVIGAGLPTGAAMVVAMPAGVVAALLARRFAQRARWHVRKARQLVRRERPSVHGARPFVRRESAV